MEDKTLTIPIDKIREDFKQFLTPEHNRRIIFSGPFGIGKTYFLHEFFDANEEYFPIFLRPINYSLLSNEDVFRFIKYDILCQLVENENFEVEDSFDFTEWDYTKLFLGQNGFAILFNLLKYMPKIGTYVKASQKLGVLVEKFQEGLKRFNDNKELKLLKEFGEQTDNHFLFENDGVTEFISQQLEKIVSQQSEAKQKKKKVLIIDDLDRLDPEHIFRLFNVFSAHFDQVHYYENEAGNDNKFGFDKVVFVCDIENIRKIFAHKYGSEVDFSGYIDKFYSTEVYQFLHDNIYNTLIKPYFRDKFAFYNSQNRFLETNELFDFILRILFKGREFSIREIVRLGLFKPSFISKNNIVSNIPVMLTKMGAKENSKLEQYDLLVLMKLFFDFFGGVEIFVKKMNQAYLRISEKEESVFAYQYIRALSNLILFADSDSHRFANSESKDKNPKEFELKIHENQVIKYQLIGGYYSDYYKEGDMWFRIDLNGIGDIKLANGFFYGLLIKAVRNIVNEGIL